MPGGWCVARITHRGGDVIREACCVVMPGVGVQAWPATLRGVHGDRERFESTYFSQFKGYYTTGDNVRRDGAPPPLTSPPRTVLDRDSLHTERYPWRTVLHSRRAVVPTGQFFITLRVMMPCLPALHLFECIKFPRTSGFVLRPTLQERACGPESVSHCARCKHWPPGLCVNCRAPWAGGCSAATGVSVSVEDGYYWVLGRMDDIINVSGHRIGTAEVESALVAHPACAEAAAVGYEHPIKGLGIYAYVTPIAGATFTDGLQKELRECVAPPPPPPQLTRRCCPTAALLVYVVTR